MTKFKTSLIVLATLLCVSTAFAGAADMNATEYNRHTGVYLGGTLGAGLGGVRDKTGETQGGFEGFGGNAVLGYQFNPNIGLEADFTGITTVFTSSFYTYGVMVRGILPIGNRVALYGKLGVGAITVEVCDFIFNSGQCVTQTKAAGLAGAGVSVALSKQLDLVVDYTGGFNRNNGMDGLYGVFGAGLLYHFK